MKGAARDLLAAVRDTLESPEYIALAGRDGDRAILVAEAVCDALASRGRVQLPSGARFRSGIERLRRDLRIAAQRRAGLSWTQLSARHGLSIRQLRRIAGRYLSGRPDTPPAGDSDTGPDPTAGGPPPGGGRE